MMSHSWRSWLGLVVAGVVAACSSDPTGLGGSSGVRLNVFARLGTVSTATAPAVRANVAAAGPVASIEIDEVAIVIGGLKLETAGVDGTDDVMFDESRVVFLDLTGLAVATVFDLPL